MKENTLFAHKTIIYISINEMILIFLHKYFPQLRNKLMREYLNDKLIIET